MNTNLSEVVWVADDDQSICWVLQRALQKAGYEVQVFADGESLLQALQSTQPGVILSDIKMPGIDGIELLQRINARHEELPVVIMTAFGDLDSAVESYKRGAFEYLPKPFDINEAVSLVRRALSSTLSSQSVEPMPSANNLLRGESPPMQEIFRIIGRLAGSSMSVLIRGESGTGKELVAQALFQNSPRSTQPFIAINTAAIPSELLESELFGHEKGAFTGAHSRHIGRFEQAHGGTLFLDEIGDMPAGLQTRLLRVLSEGSFYRVGGREQVDVDVRVIAATNQNLEAQVENGAFRNDLFHRLNVIALNLPALKQRGDDVELLLHLFLTQVANQLGVAAKQVDSAVIEALHHYSWPGNVRELENLCRRLVVMAPGKSIHLSDLPPEYQLLDEVSEAQSWENLVRLSAAKQLALGKSGLIQQMAPRFEKALIDAAMAFTGGHKRKSAELLGWGRNTLTRKLQQ